jgi:hypothetical protein
MFKCYLNQLRLERVMTLHEMYNERVIIIDVLGRTCFGMLPQILSGGTELS